MESIFVVLLLLGPLMAQINSADSRNDITKLSRRKRYVAFPEGATLSIAICMTIQTIIYQNSEIFTEGINWGISYDLPNNTATVKEFLYPRHVMQRRHRRDLYQKMELIMDSMGYGGRVCIQRALCEAGATFKSREDNLVGEILRIVFGFPQQRLLSSEPDEHRQYQGAHREGREGGVERCMEKFPGCSISLLDMALGYYGEQTPAFM